MDPSPPPHAAICPIHHHSSACIRWLIRRFRHSQRHAATNHVQLIENYLRSHKFAAETLHGLPVQSVVAIIPSILSNPSHKSLLNAAVDAVGIGIALIIERAVYAACAYSPGMLAGRTVLVFEISSSITEISLLASDNDNDIRMNFSVVSCAGDLGCPIFNHAVSQIERACGFDVGGDNVALDGLRSSCENAKNRLSSGAGSAEVSCESQGIGFSFKVDRRSLVELNRKHFRDGITSCLNNGGGVEPHAMDEIVLVGDYVHLPEVRGILGEMFGGKPVR